MFAGGCVWVGQDYREGHFNGPWVGEIGSSIGVNEDEWPRLEFLWFDGVSQRGGLVFVFRLWPGYIYEDRRKEVVDHFVMTVRKRRFGIEDE